MVWGKGTFMKNICFLIRNLNHSGGTERVTSLIANELVEKGYTVSILSLAEGMEPFFQLNPNIVVSGLYPKKISMKSNFLGAVWRIRRYVQQNDINTLIVVDSIACVFTVPAMFGLKVQHICWEHFNFNVDLGVSYRRAGRQWAAKYCDQIVTLTKRDKALWQAGLKDIRAQIVPIANPTPYSNIDSMPNLEAKIILALGRLTNQKGFDLLIDAWSKVCDHNLDWTLRIVGGGEDELKLKEQAKMLGIYDRIEFLAPTKDVTLHYESCSYYCMSSRFEGLPMVLLEAQAFGLPIISFDCDTGPSDLIQDGIQGILVQALNVNQLAEALLTAINMPSEQYSQMSRMAKEQSQHFQVDTISEQWVELIN